MNLQDSFLAFLKKEKNEVVIYLVNGFQLRGIITGFDNFTILFENTEGKPQMVYKHAVTTVHPVKGIDYELFKESVRSLSIKKPAD